MSDATDAKRTAILSEKLEGQRLDVAVTRLMTLVLALCEMLDEKGVDSTALLEGMTFNEEQYKEVRSNGRYGTA